MIKEDYNTGWRQHFPTYSFVERDIAIEEYKVAAKNLESEERVFLNASNVTLVALTALGSLIVGSSNSLTTSLNGVIPPIAIIVALMMVASIFSFISLKYFADRQRAIQFSARKLVVLRRMLGLSYGEIQMILPNWRVEGADQPFALKLFPGWGTYVAYPFWIIALISCSVNFFLLAYISKSLPEPITNIWIVIALIIWFVMIIYVYRSSLFDTHENSRLLFYKFIAKLVSLPLVENFEYIIYRAKLATFENSRIHIDTSNLLNFLVFIEDRKYPNFHGIDYKALARALLSFFGKGRSSGGSTIHQQLIRTLFIYDLRKVIRRKFVEWGLSPWLNAIFSEKYILEIYLASVRFEKQVFGVAAAMKYFWGGVTENPSNAQSFFLVERISNIKSGLLVQKIIQTARNAELKGLLTPNDLIEITSIYSKAVADGFIKTSDEKLSDLRNGLST